MNVRLSAPSRKHSYLLHFIALLKMIASFSIKRYVLYTLAFAGLLRPVCCTASSGCGLANQTGGDFTIVSGGTTRQYRLNLPNNYNPNTATGLLLSYHGNSRTNIYQESLTAFSDPNVNPNLIAVYPQGLGVSTILAMHFQYPILLQIADPVS